MVDYIQILECENPRVLFFKQLRIKISQTNHFFLSILQHFLDTHIWDFFSFRIV